MLPLIDLGKMHAEATASGQELVFRLPMQRQHNVLGLCAIVCSSDPFDMVEAVVDESRYKVAENYKISLRATDQNYGVEHFYIIDLQSLMRRHPEEYSVEVREKVPS